MSNESVKFVLKTHPLGSSHKNVDNTNFTWTNINLRKVLGYDMYEKYDTFKLTLSQISSVAVDVDSEYGITVNDKLVNIIITGLPFQNGTYDTRLNMITNKCYISVYKFPKSANIIYPFDQPYTKETSVCFNKNQESCNLNIYYTTVDTDLIPTASAFPYPDVIFEFVIEGVKLSNYNNTNYRQMKM